MTNHTALMTSTHNNRSDCNQNEAKANIFITMLMLNLFIFILGMLIQYCPFIAVHTLSRYKNTIHHMCHNSTTNDVCKTTNVVLKSDDTLI